MPRAGTGRRSGQAAAGSTPRGGRPRFEGIVDALSVAVLVFREQKLIYVNAAAAQLRERLRSKYRLELTVLLSDHLTSLGRLDTANTISLLTGQRGEPFYLHVIPLDDAGLDVAVSVRELGTSMGAFRTRYRLSKREADVVELVLLGYRNKDIAATLGTSPTTIKKHLTHIFDKVGVDTRTQLIARIA